jgi:transcriptional regulator with XRE-family HTH domain
MGKHSVLRTLRSRLGISQRTAAKEAGVNPIQWAQVETGADDKSFSAAGWLAIWDTFSPTLADLGYGCEDLLRGHRKPGVKRAA